MAQFQPAFDAANFERVDLAAVKAASIRSIETLVMRWLPKGRRQGHEWVTLNPTRGDNKPGSFSINLKTGTWADFATGDRGGDAIDLLVYLTGKKLIEAAKEIGDLLGVKSTTASIHPFTPGERAPAVLSPQDVLRDPAVLPPRTRPDADGQPRFIIAGDDGPNARRDELRRHVYRVGTTPVKIKIMRRGDTRAMIWYRVSNDAVTGWQSRKPSGFKDVPFIGSIDPFDPDMIDQDIYWAEGEKDAATLSNKGFASFSFGGCGDGLPRGCEEYVRGRHVVIPADNDAEGMAHAKKKASLASTVAASVRILSFDDLPPKGDVSDWFAISGNTADALREIVEALPLDPQPSRPDRQDNPAPSPIKATPYVWTDPELIPKRDFIYGRHLIRKFVSATVAPGGVGKSSLIVTEVAAMVSGVNLLGIQPHGRSRIWLWNIKIPEKKSLGTSKRRRSISGWLRKIWKVIFGSTAGAISAWSRPR